ncbi:MAG: hypothetical protein ACK5L5_07750 [Bacteroidales bacterium]
MASMEVLQKQGNTIGKENILILGNYRNNRIFYRTMEEYNIDYPNIYNTNSLDIPAETIDYPYFFILDKDLKISNVFVPDKGLPNITIEYLDGFKNINI